MCIRDSFGTLFWIAFFWCGWKIIRNRYLSVPEKDRTFAFISHKTDPDRASAEQVTKKLREYCVGVELVPDLDQEDEECPYSFGSNEADVWIKEKLGGKLRRCDVLVLIMSEEALKSGWLQWEFITALGQSWHKSRVAILLWTGGRPPEEVFFPVDDSVFRRLLPIPMWKIDARTDLKGTSKRLGQYLLQFETTQNSLGSRRAIFVLVFYASLLFVGLITGYIGFNIWHPSQFPYAVRKFNSAFLYWIVAVPYIFWAYDRYPRPPSMLVDEYWGKGKAELLTNGHVIRARIFFTCLFAQPFANLVEPLILESGSEVLVVISTLLRMLTVLGLLLVPFLDLGPQIAFFWRHRLKSWAENVVGPTQAGGPL